MCGQTKLKEINEIAVNLVNQVIERSGNVLKVFKCEEMSGKIRRSKRKLNQDQGMGDKVRKRQER